MINITDLKVGFKDRFLFKDVNLKFTPGNCYGLIGANGSGKSTFLKVLSGEIAPDSGEIHIAKSLRMSVLRQDRNAFDAYTVADTVIMGYERLYKVMKEKDALYAKPDFSDEDGLRASELEGEFAELNGWEAESEAASLLNGLGLPSDVLEKQMSELESSAKVQVLLAQALFGNPDILLLDEPTNYLDLEAITWFEEFLYRFTQTVIVVSHDRHFLNKVCTHTADIDFGKIRIYVGNYDFWQQTSRLISRQQKEHSQKQEARAKELKAFIQRFSANASKSKQATSRKKELEKLDLEDLPVSTRKFPYIAFKPERMPGKVVLETKNLGKQGRDFTLENFSFSVAAGDKITLISDNSELKTGFFRLITGEDPDHTGEYLWGVTIKHSYFPGDNSAYFKEDLSILDWLRQFSKEQDATFLRGYLGRMLFSGEEALKSVKVLSGGERVRCMLTRMMLENANVLLFDNPTAHLDLEAITSLNNSLIDYEGVVLFCSHDHEFVNTVANRIIEFIPGGRIIDRRMPFDDYLKSEEVKTLRTKLYGESEHHLQI